MQIKFYGKIKKMGNIDGFGQYKIGGTGGGGGISTGRMVSTASFQGWREAPLKGSGSSGRMT